MRAACKPLVGVLVVVLSVLAGAAGAQEPPEDALVRQTVEAYQLGGWGEAGVSWGYTKHTYPHSCLYDSLHCVAEFTGEV